MTEILYGIKRPRWYVRLRGLKWLRSGFCPCCYSSPPLPECPVCRGDNDYGPGVIDDSKRELWRSRFLTRGGE